MGNNTLMGFPGLKPGETFSILEKTYNAGQENQETH